jgi:hypothetical protein
MAHGSIEGLTRDFGPLLQDGPRKILVSRRRSAFFSML